MKNGMLLVLVLAFLALVAGTVRAEMYIEGYLGYVRTPEVSHELTINHPAARPGLPSGSGEILKTDDALLDVLQGGFKLGAWFEQRGVFSEISFPPWMKYLGFYLDFSYHAVANEQGWRTSVSTYRSSLPPKKCVLGAVPGVGCGNITNDGFAITIAFMFALRYGFFPTEKVPFGWLQPYIAVGPAIVISSQDLDIEAIRITAGKPGAAERIPYYVNPSAQTSTDIALAVETGVRIMVLKNVSLDASFKFRHVEPHYRFEALNGWSVRAGVPTRFSFDHNPVFNFLSFQFGAAYHF